MHSIRFWKILSTSAYSYVCHHGRSYSKRYSLSFSNSYNKINRLCVLRPHTCISGPCALHSNLSPQRRRLDSSSSLLTKENLEADTISQVNKVLQHLKLDLKRGNQIFSIEVESTLNQLRLDGPSAFKDDLDPAIILLQCCGDLMADKIPDKRLEIAQKVWDKLHSLGAHFQVSHYNTLLVCYAANKHPVSITEFIDMMGDVKPDEETFHLLLRCACEVGNMEQATEVISCMKDRGFPVSEPVFNALILGHSCSGNVASAREVMETMKTALISPSSETYTAFLRGLAEVGDFDNVIKIYQEAISDGCLPSSKQIIEILKSLAVSGHAEIVQAVLPWLPELSVESSHPMRHLLIQLVHLGLVQPVVLLLPSLPLDETTPHGKFLVREAVNANWEVSSIVKLCSALSEHNTLALSQATEAALQQCNVSLAVQLLTALKQQDTVLRPHYFWPLLLEEARSYGEEGVFAILGHMNQLGVVVNYNTLAGFVLPSVSLALPGVLVRKLQDCGISLSTVFGAVVAALLKRVQVEEAVQLCDLYTAPMNGSHLVWPLVMAYSKGANLSSTIEFIKQMKSRSIEADDWTGRFMLEVLTNKKLKAKPEHIEEVIKAFYKAELRCSTFAADIISQNITKMPETDKSIVLCEALSSMVDPEVFIAPTELFAHHMKHPREMNLDELEGHLIELKSKNLNTRGLLRRLLQQYCRSGDLEKALQTKREFEASGHELTLGMRAALFDLYVRVGQLDSAESCLKELSQSDTFNLDDHKVIDFATLLVANGRNKAAVTMLEQHASKGNVRGGQALSQNCRRLLNTMAEQGVPRETKELFDVLVSCGYCAVSNTLLGPLIRTFINCGDLEGAVAEYKNFCVKHNKTPLQHELMCRLVEVTDQTSDPNTTMLQQVVDATRKVHGAASTNVVLIVALAETGRTKQLHRLLKSLGTKLRGTLLMSRCRRLVDENKLQVLENLVAAFRGLNSIDLAPLYMFMLQIHCREGDCNGALLLWTTMQEQDCHPCSEFLLTLAELLKTHKREVPFAVSTNVEASVIRK